MFDRALYRARQLRRSLNPRTNAEDLRAARETLGERLYPLFESMQPADQQHCLDVYKALSADGCDEAEMLQAALLHDAGKGRFAGARFGVPHRVAYVVLSGAPAVRKLTARWSAGMRALEQHDRKTLELAREYGASEAVVRLIAEMETGGSERAKQLKAADDGA